MTDWIDEMFVGGRGQLVFAAVASEAVGVHDQMQHVLPLHNRDRLVAQIADGLNQVLRGGQPSGGVRYRRGHALAWRTSRQKVELLNTFGSIGRPRLLLNTASAAATAAALFKFRFEYFGYAVHAYVLQAVAFVRVELVLGGLDAQRLVLGARLAHYHNLFVQMLPLVYVSFVKIVKFIFHVYI